MEAKTYTLSLIGDDVRDEFLEEIEDRYEVVYVYKNIPSALKIRLTESEREELLKHIYVIEIEQGTEHTSPSLFTYSGEKTVTVKNPSTSEVGSNYISAVHKYMTDGVTTTNPNGIRNVGLKNDFFQPSMVGSNYSSYLTGEHVDIVTLETTGGISPNISYAPRNYHKTHPEYYFPGTTTTRCVEMNWKNYNSSIEFEYNIDQSTRMLSNHGASVLSCAGGILGGLAKKASLRHIITSGDDDYPDVCDAIVSWHNSKPTNSVTGKKNPTIVLLEVVPVQDHLFNAVKITDIASFNIRGTTTNRPNSARNPELNGWKLSDFVDNNMLPKLVPVNYSTSPNDPYEWCIVFAGQYAFDGIPSGSIIFERNATNSLINAGIHVLAATGNDCGVFSKYDSDDYDNYITTDTNYSSHKVTDKYRPEQQTDGPQDFYVHRSVGPTGHNPNQIDVGARQPSEETPSIDGYSSRGPVVDIFGLGRGTWSSDPEGQDYSDGYRYGTFSGTSAATPTVAGVAACILEYQYLTTGSYPDVPTLKNLLLGAANSNEVKNYETIDWDADPSPEAKDQYAASNWYDTSKPALIIPYSDSKITGVSQIIATDLVGASTRGAFLPDVYRTYNPDTGQATPTPTPPVPSPSGPCVHPTIKGPTGSVSSPPYNYAQSYDKYEGSRGSPGGIYFQPQGEESNYPPENISYVNFRLRLRSFGPRGGNGETIYLTSNRGNRDTNKGRVRKWYTEFQSVVDNNPDLYTTNKGEAFVPFRIHFRVGFVAGGNGNYRILYSNHYHDWSNFEYKDIDFDSTEMARQNNLPTDGSGKIIFPDFGTKNYTPRIYEIKADIYNLDLNPNEGEAKNRINMFAQATTDSDKAKESQVLEFGKYVIT